MDDCYAESDCDYRIAMSRQGERHCYLVYSPARPGWSAGLAVRYAIGEPVPRSRQLLGTADTADKARAIADGHYEERHDAA